MHGRRKDFGGLFHDQSKVLKFNCIRSKPRKQPFFLKIQKEKVEFQSPWGAKASCPPFRRLRLHGNYIEVISYSKRLSFEPFRLSSHVSPRAI